MAGLLDDLTKTLICGASATFVGNTYTCNQSPHSGMKMHRDGMANGGVGQEWPKIAGVPWTGDAM